MGTACVGDPPSPNKSASQSNGGSSSRADAAKETDSKSTQAGINAPAAAKDAGVMASEQSNGGSSGMQYADAGPEGGASGKTQGGHGGTATPAMASSMAGASATMKCWLAPNTDACDQCIASRCDAVCIDCGNDEGCHAFWDCALDCEDDTACNNRCTRQLSQRSLQRSAALATCITDTCGSPCGWARIGDFCDSSDQCVNGMCLANSCTLNCQTDADCGTNSSGAANLCLPSQVNGTLCFPGCRTAADCGRFPGRSCLSNGTVGVCSAASNTTMSSGSSDCRTCVSMQCGPQWNACLNDAGCKTWSSCDCSDGSCSCSAMLSSASLAIVEQIAACLQQRCPQC
jgi:hypothetical protein